jgi:transposase
MPELEVIGEVDSRTQRKFARRKRPSGRGRRKHRRLRAEHRALARRHKNALATLDNIASSKVKDAGKLRKQATSALAFEANQLKIEVVE